MILEEEISVFRSPSEYLQWFRSHLETTGGDRALRGDALQHKGIFKQFYEELFPLYSLLKHKQREWSNSRFRNVLGSQPYDVEIENNSMSYIEIGTTEFDDGELFRMREFLAEGHVNAIGRTIRDDRDRPIAIQDEARSHEEMVQERVDSISALIESKSQKTYPHATGLVVYYDDSSIMFAEDDNDTLRSCIDSLKPKWQCTFDAVFLVGPRGDVLIEVAK